MEKKKKKHSAPDLELLLPQNSANINSHTDLLRQQRKKLTDSEDFTKLFDFELKVKFIVYWFPGTEFYSQFCEFPLREDGFIGLEQIIMMFCTKSKLTNV